MPRLRQYTVDDGELKYIIATANKPLSAASCEATTRTMRWWNCTGRCWECGRWACTRTARLVEQGVVPEQISFAGVWRAYRRPMREYKSPPDPGEQSPN